MLYIHTLSLLNQTVFLQNSDHLLNSLYYAYCLSPQTRQDLQDNGDLCLVCSLMYLPPAPRTMPGTLQKIKEHLLIEKSWLLN